METGMQPMASVEKNGDGTRSPDGDREGKTGGRRDGAAEEGKENEEGLGFLLRGRNEAREDERGEATLRLSLVGEGEEEEREEAALGEGTEGGGRGGRDGGGRGGGEGGLGEESSSNEASNEARIIWKRGGAGGGR